jgi:uncharacterized protein YhfF
MVSEQLRSELGVPAMHAVSGSTQAFWAEFLRSTPNASDAESRRYEAMRIGDTRESGNHGAQLILSGAKTATSSLEWEYEQLDRARPQIGSLSVVENGQGEPVCIVETTWLEILPFEQIDAAFAAAYGEWDGTLETWRTENWAYNSKRCRALGRTPTLDMPLVCERFKVVYKSPYTGA